ALKQAKKFRKDVWTDDSDCSDEDERATDTAYGAVFMVVSACSRDPYTDVTGPETNDIDLLPDSIETSYSCACAETGATNTSRVHQTDVPARRAFWLWYLDEAIPTVLTS
ncbi:Imm5 family immunity protein, partial [Actinomyces sp.]